MQRIGPDDLVLDVGAGARPFARADWVIDLMPYETRGLYGYDKASASERFSADTWVVHDICAREPWPFSDDKFDFAVCSHTLEDVRDPIWVCSELVRVARAGYIEVPSRLEEHSWGFEGPWVGFGHHRWLVDVADGGLQFVFKHHVIHGPAANWFPNRFHRRMSEEDKAQALYWEGSFDYGERIMLTAEELDPYLSEYVAAHRSGSRVRDRISDLLKLASDRIR
jgi:hypothetical protein